MDLLEKFKANWKQQFGGLRTAECNLLLAVSGGIDSIVLTDLAYKYGFNFIIAHCNFQLRGEESNRDEQFVKTIGTKYNKEVLVKRFDTTKYAAENKLSIQEGARNLRYQWFREMIEGQLPNSPLTTHHSQLTTHHSPLTTHYIATAHHANDNIETVLINFFRGTGISGLHGILPKQNKIIRPLLFAKRAEIESYAKENGLNWVEDSSNTSDKYTRNFFRLNLLPQIKEIFPNVEENLLNNIERFKETEILYNQAIEVHKKKLVEQKGNEFHIPILKLQKSAPLNSIIWEIIKHFGFSAAQVDEAKKLFAAENASYISSASHRIIKNRNWLIIAPLQAGAAQNILIEKGERKVVFENGILLLEEMEGASYKLQAASDIAGLDAAEIKFPLLLRKWKQGDYFYPLGMLNLPAGRQGKKKLNRFFIDIKLSKTEKEKIWVIESDKKILWVTGHRIDERFKIKPSTKKVLHIRFEKRSEK